MVFLFVFFFLLTNYRLSRYNVLFKMGNMIGDDFGALGYELYPYRYRAGKKIIKCDNQGC